MSDTAANIPLVGESFENYVKRMRIRLQVAGDLIRNQEGKIANLLAACENARDALLDRDQTWVYYTREGIDLCDVIAKAQETRAESTP